MKPLRLTATLFILFFVCRLSAQKETVFCLPDGSGILRFGLVTANQDIWLDTDKRPATDNLLSIEGRHLDETEGYIIEVSGTALPEGAMLAWTFGGCDSPGPVRDIHPEYCKDNVFSIEGTSITVYHGKVMRLRITQLVTSKPSDIRLADGHRQESPQTLFLSGKKTDAPVVASLCPIAQGEKIYFCLYKPNGKADYADYMLPDLFKKENK